MQESVSVTSLTQDARQVGVPEGAPSGVVPLADGQVPGAETEILLLVATAHRPVCLGPRPVLVHVWIAGKFNLGAVVRNWFINGFGGRIQKLLDFDLL